MKPVRRFNVFGEPVEILVSSAMSNGSLNVITQTCQPGGGPPPHRHTKEDEFFTVLEGEFEFFDGKGWHRLLTDQMQFGPRGGIHTFRSCGTTNGKILIVASPGGLDRYLEEISPLIMPTDAERLFEISNPYGISFVQSNQRMSSRENTVTLK